MEKRTWVRTGDQCFLHYACARKSNVSETNRRWKNCRCQRWHMLLPKDRDKSDDRLFPQRRRSGNTLEAKHFASKPVIRRKHCCENHGYSLNLLLREDKTTQGRIPSVASPISTGSTDPIDFLIAKIANMYQTHFEIGTRRIETTQIHPELA